MLRRMGPPEGVPAILMDRAYEGDATRQLAAQLGYTPVVPPKKNRTHPWEYVRRCTGRRCTGRRCTGRRCTGRRCTGRRCTGDVVPEDVVPEDVVPEDVVRNEVERLFRRLKGFRRVFTRYDKLDALYLGFILFAIIFDALRSVNTR